MASFAWSEEAFLEGRFDRGIDQEVLDLQEGSRAAWEKLVVALQGSRTERQALDASDTFFHAMQSVPQRPLTHPRVFVSHRQNAAHRGERIARIASKRGMEYWLDVHDSTLRNAMAFQGALGPVLYAIVVAAIVEMALVNCTHVIAAHTGTAQPNGAWIPSQWIPYEFGRAKARQIVSSRAAGWFEAAITSPQSRGEYVLLADVLRSDQAVKDWFRKHIPTFSGSKPFRGRLPTISLDAP